MLLLLMEESYITRDIMSIHHFCGIKILQLIEVGLMTLNIPRSILVSAYRLYILGLGISDNRCQQVTEAVEMK